LREYVPTQCEVYCYFHGNETIADELQIGINTVKEAKRKLRSIGWTSRESQRVRADGTFSTVVEKIHLPWHGKAPTVEAPAMAQKTSHGTVAPSTDVGKTTQQKEYSINSEVSPAPSAPADSGEPFEVATYSPTYQSSVSLDEEEATSTPQGSQAQSSQAKKEQPQNREWEMPLSGSIITYSKLWAYMQLCWKPFRGFRPSDEEANLFAEVMAKCDENCCMPDDVMDWAKKHMPPKLYGGLRSVKGLHNAVCGNSVSTTNGLVAQFKEHQNPNDCPICLKRIQGVTCATQGCKSWVKLGHDGNPTEYCPGCTKKIPAYRRNSGSDPIITPEI
jgi:hypothetical protein